MNPMSWAIPLFRAFGVQVRVHVLFFVVTIGLCLREAFKEGAYVSPVDCILFLIPMLFGIILIHEYGHVFGGRSVGGESEEILIWPLGGLAFVDTPREWKAHAITAAAGPLMNVLMGLIASVFLVGAGFLPTLSPIANPYLSPMKNLKDGRVYTSEYGYRLYEKDSAVPAGGTEKVEFSGKPQFLKEQAEASQYERAVAPGWAVWVNRFFWLNYVLLLLNLIPAFPLDGGQIMQSLIWARSDYRHGTSIACFSGYLCGAIFFVVSIAAVEPLWLALAGSVLIACYLQLRRLQEGYGEFGGGEYGSSFGNPDDEESNSKPSRKVGFFKKLAQARAAKKFQREHEQRAKDDERMDQLLDKIARKEALTAEEKRFMQRVSERYRK